MDMMLETPSGNSPALFYGPPSQWSDFGVARQSAKMPVAPSA